MDNDQVAAKAKFAVPYVARGMKDPSNLVLRVDKSLDVRGRPYRNPSGAFPIVRGTSSERERVTNCHRAPHISSPTLPAADRGDKEVIFDVKLQFARD